MSLWRWMAVGFAIDFALAARRAARSREEMWCRGLFTEAERRELVRQALLASRPFQDLVARHGHMSAQDVMELLGLEPGFTIEEWERATGVPWPIRPELAR